MYRVFEALDELVTLCESARGVPMTTSCVVPRGDVLELLDEVREAIPGELDDAQDVLDRRDALVLEATTEAEAARADAHAEADRILTEAREQAATLVAEAEHEAERTVHRGRREYAEATERAGVDADAMITAGRESYERAVDDAREEQARLVAEHEVTVTARAEAARLVDDAREEAHRERSECDHYVDSALSDFGDTLESVLDTVGRHRHQLRIASSGGYGERTGHPERNGEHADEYAGERVGA